MKGLALSEPKGFTLIELLIVIAVLGVLAAGVLIAINPAEQLARARDSSRKTAVGQLSRALQAYYTSQSTYPPVDNTWITTLVNAGEIKSAPAPTTYTIVGTGGWTTCVTNSQNGYCYTANGNRSDAVAFVRMESRSENAKCAPPHPNQNNYPALFAYFIWNSGAGSGIICMWGGAGGSEPVPHWLPGPEFPG